MFQTTQPCAGHIDFQRPFWRDFLRASYRKLSIQEEFICLNTTGFRETHKSAYYLSQKERLKAREVAIRGLVYAFHR